MEDYGLISVIIPVYNTENYLKKCLNSVYEQSYKNIEVIMVDDGSTDASPKICQEYQDKDSRFTLIQKENGGVSSARNKGLDNAHGDYVLFMDCDDWITENAIESLISTAKNECADLVFFEANAVDDNNLPLARYCHIYHDKYMTNEPYRIMKDMMYHKEFYVVIWSMFIKRDIIENNHLRFNEGYYYEDLIISYQIYSLAKRAAHVQKPLYNRTYRDDSFTARKKSRKHFLSAIDVYNKVVQFTNTLPEEKKNYQHIVRCALNAINDYDLLSKSEKKVLKSKYELLKKDICRHDFFYDKALQCRCMGYYLWIAYKGLHKIFIGDKYDFYNHIKESPNRKKVMLLISEMIGGGAERVAAQLINQMDSNGIDTKFVVSKTNHINVVRRDLKSNIPLILLADEMPSDYLVNRMFYKLLRIFSTLLCKPFEMFHKQVPAVFAKLSIISQHSREIKYIKGMLQAEPDMTVIAFLQPTIPIALLAAQNLPNKVIISERADPNRLMKRRYGRKFIEKYYTRADAAVFQTEDAKAVYPKVIADKGTVIFNPLKDNLPMPYHGERNKNITTFCRISNQKNLPVLVDAFAKVHTDHSDYTLRIIGDAPNEEGEQVLRTIKTMISDYKIEDSVIFEPFKANVHDAIIKDAMYVSSSDYEGISNAMLEAMAIGMPVVCTDCPIGGAKATITDGENGLLVPIQDADALGKAINRVIEEDGLAEKISQNATLIREELSLEKISAKWEKLITN